MKYTMVALTLLCSCVQLDPDEAEVHQHLTPNCDDWGCGMNSPQIDQYGFHELALDGSKNAEGSAIKSFRLANNPDVKLDVEYGRVTATDIHGHVYEGSSLIDSVLTLTHGSQEVYYLRFVNVSETKMWTADAKVIPSYEIHWSANGKVWTNMCKLAGNIDPNDALGMDTFKTLIFEGERISSKDKKIGANLDPGWINFGCAGSTLAKLFLVGRTEAARKYGVETTIPERQAALKMFSADYCGGGTPFTVAGQRLQWMDAQGTLKYDPSLQVALEARWDASGATCLDKPRLIANPTQLGWDVFQDATTLTDAITKECQNALHDLPPCTGDVDDVAGKFLNSANPY